MLGGSSQEIVDSAQLYISTTHVLQHATCMRLSTTCSVYAVFQQKDANSFVLTVLGHPVSFAGPLVPSVER